MQIRIEASDLPGRVWGPCPDFPDGGEIHVGVQRKDRPAELLDLHPGDAEAATWTLDCSAVTGPAGTEISGPYIQNRLGGRFVYLSWVTLDGNGAPRMFRRAKLMIDAVDPDVVEAATRSGRLVARLRLTDACGGPLCARVLPPLVHWSAA